MVINEQKIEINYNVQKLIKKNGWFKRRLRKSKQIKRYIVIEI